MSELKSNDDLHPIPTKPSDNGEMIEDTAVTHDAVFGDITAEGPNFRNVRDQTTSPRLYPCEMDFSD